jgi:hypothetical protein
MSWTNIPNANLAIGAPIRSIDQLALRDNPIAIAEGATGAPRVRAEALNGGQSGSAPIFAARAWVNFNGATTTPSIRSSGNVSSVTRSGTGDFTINFTTAMVDANFSALATASFSGTSGNWAYNADVLAATTTSQRVVTGFNTGTAIISDVAIVNVSIFR